MAGVAVLDQWAMVDVECGMGGGEVGVWTLLSDTVLPVRLRVLLQLLWYRSTASERWQPRAVR